MIRFPWPAYNLSQNGAHGHFRAHAARLKAYHKLAAEAIEGQPVPTLGEGDIRLTVTFHPPTITRPDLDNAITRMKAGIDALAEAWEVNDNRFEYDLRHGEKIKGGCVTVEVTA